jgi:hypothetical protein
MRYYAHRDGKRARFRVRPRKDKRGVELISDALPFGRLWYAEPNAIGNAMHSSCSHDARKYKRKRRKFRD